MRALGVFVTAPIPGRVTPRLTEDVGPSTAAEVYWRVGRRVVAAVAGSGYRTIVWYTPAGEAAFIREWLEGVGRLELRPQSGGAPAARLQVAFTRLFSEGAGRVVLAGSTFPGLDRRLIADAFAGLSQWDVVIGPAVSGGLYLLGLRASQPELLGRMPWRAGAAAAHVRTRATALGLSVRILGPLWGIRTLQDARVLGYLNS